MATDTKTDNKGRIEEIQGVVIEAVFPDELPAINSAITQEILEIVAGEDALG
jgi:F-type H+-transporting ATPase subunit beta